MTHAIEKLAPFKHNRIRESYLLWMKSMIGQPTHAVTLTFKRFDKSSGDCWSIEIVQKACRVFLGILNKKIFGNAATRKRRCIGSAVIIGRGRYKCNPHAHFALVSPSRISQDHFKKLIHASASLIWWVKGRGHVQAYWSEGWLSYMIDHGTESLMLDMCTQGK